MIDAVAVVGISGASSNPEEIEVWVQLWAVTEAPIARVRMCRWVRTLTQSGRCTSTVSQGITGRPADECEQWSSVFLFVIVRFS